MFLRPFRAVLFSHGFHGLRFVRREASAGAPPAATFHRPVGAILSSRPVEPLAGEPPVPHVFWLLFLLFALFAAGCRQQEAPETAGDRLVVLSPGLAATLVDLGVADTIAGRHAYDMALDPSVPICGDQSGVDYEKLLTLRPTHVLLEWGERPLPERLVSLASDRGWELVNYRLRTLDELIDTSDDLARRFAPDRRPPSARFDEALRREPGLESLGPVLLLASVDPPSVVGPGSFHHDILVRLGGVPAIGADHPMAAMWIELDAEDVLTLDPGAIVLIRPRPGASTDPGTPARRPKPGELGAIGRLPIRAVELGRLGVIEQPLALTPSTAMIDLADQLRATLRAWADGEDR